MGEKPISEGVQRMLQAVMEDVERVHAQPSRWRRLARWVDACWAWPVAMVLNFGLGILVGMLL